MDLKIETSATVSKDRNVIVAKDHFACQAVTAEGTLKNPYFRNLNSGDLLKVIASPEIALVEGTLVIMEPNSCLVAINNDEGGYHIARIDEIAATIEEPS